MSGDWYVLDQESDPVVFTVVRRFYGDEDDVIEDIRDFEDPDELNQWLSDPKSPCNLRDTP
jgi:hypothetical protein